MNINLTHCEDLWITLDYKNTLCTIGAVYRHPQENITLFQEKMEHALHNLNKSKGTYYIVEDLNINNNNTVIKSYSNMIYSQECLPIITQLTRITENSFTLIDHIYSNNTTKEMILLHDLTDYMSIIVSTNLKKLNQKPYMTYTRHKKF